MTDYKTINENHQLLITSISCCYSELPSSEYRSERNLLSSLYSIVSNDLNNHMLGFSTDDLTKVSYASKPEFQYDSSRRIKTTLGRYIRRNLAQSASDVSDAKLEFLVDKIFKIKMTGSEPTILEGEDLISAYSKSKGCSSCMTGEHSTLMKLLGVNPTKVKLVVNTGARALLWFTDEGAVILDRVYADRGLFRDLLKAWARKNDFLDRSAAENHRGDYFDNDYHVTLSLKDITCFPYLDTFKYANIDKENDLIILKTHVGKNSHVLLSTEGKLINACYVCGYEGSYLIGSKYQCHQHLPKYMSCSRCGESCRTDTLNFLSSDNRMCSHCYSNLPRCYNCDSRAIANHVKLYIHLSDGSVNIQTWCEHCITYYSNSGTVRCKKCGTYHRSEQIRNLPYDIYYNYICDSCKRVCVYCQCELMDNRSKVCETCRDDLREYKNEYREAIKITRKARHKKHQQQKLIRR